MKAAPVPRLQRSRSPKPPRLPGTAAHEAAGSAETACNAGVPSIAPPAAAVPTTAPRRPRGRPRDPDLRARREEEILAAAAVAFAGDGYDGLDLEVLAERIGVGKGTIYRYFPSKEALFEATVDRITVQLSARTDAAAAAARTPVERMERTVLAYLAHFDEHPEHVELIVQERAVFRDRRRPTYFRHRDAKTGRWLAEVTGLIQQGFLRDMPAARVMDVFGYALQGAIFTNHLAGRTRSFEEQAREILDVLLHGVLAARGPEDAKGPAPSARRIRTSDPARPAAADLAEPAARTQRTGPHARAKKVGPRTPGRPPRARRTR